MKYLLAIVLLAGTYFVVCEAACFHQLPEAGELPPKGCMFKGSLHPLGKSWRTSDCLDCMCAEDGKLHCCEVFMKPVTEDKNCKFIFDQKACKYVLIPNPDPEKQCRSYAMVG